MTLNRERSIDLHATLTMSMDVKYAMSIMRICNVNYATIVLLIYLDYFPIWSVYFGNLDVS